MAEANIVIDLGQILRDAGCTSALIDVAAERRRQQEAEGYTLEHDDHYREGELAQAAAALTCSAVSRFVGQQPHLNSPRDTAESFWAANASVFWPLGWGEIKQKTARRDLVRATALLLAEIERIDRDRIERLAEVSGG